MSLKDQSMHSNLVQTEAHYAPVHSLTTLSISHVMMCKSHIVKENVMCERLVTVTSSPATSTAIRTGWNKTCSQISEGHDGLKNNN